MNVCKGLLRVGMKDCVFRVQHENDGSLSYHLSFTPPCVAARLFDRLLPKKLPRRRVPCGLQPLHLPIMILSLDMNKLSMKSNINQIKQSELNIVSNISILSINFCRLNLLNIKRKYACRCRPTSNNQYRILFSQSKTICNLKRILKSPLPKSAKLIPWRKTCYWANLAF